MSRMIKCRSCGEETLKKTKKCSHCGKNSRSFIRRHKIFTAFISLVLLGSSVVGNSEEVTTKEEVVEEVAEVVEEVKESKYEGFTYEEEVALEEKVSSMITLGEEYKLVRKDFYKNDISKTAKVVYEYEDSVGIIHKYDRCIVVDLDYNVTSDGVSETKEISYTLAYEMESMFERGIKNNLTCPSTAKFNGGWLSGDSYQYGFNDNGYPVIIGYVDAENGFGAMIRQWFIGTYNYNEGVMSFDYYN